MAGLPHRLGITITDRSPVAPFFASSLSVSRLTSSCSRRNSNLVVERLRRSSDGEERRRFRVGVGLLEDEMGLSDREMGLDDREMGLSDREESELDERDESGDVAGIA